MRKGRQGTPIEGDDPINLQQALSTATFPSCYYCYLCVQRQTRTHKNTCLLIVCPKGGKAQEHIPSPTPYFSPRRATFFILPFQDTVYEGQARSNIERPTDVVGYWTCTPGKILSGYLRDKSPKTGVWQTRGYCSQSSLDPEKGNSLFQTSTLPTPPPAQPRDSRRQRTTGHLKKKKSE